MSQRSKAPARRTEDLAEGLRLRVAMMDVERRQKARRLRRAGHSPEEIARRLDATTEEVVAALGALRGRRTDPNHIALSVTRATGRFFRSLAEPGEPTWQLMDRLAIVLRQMVAETKRPRPSQRRRDGEGPRQGGFI